MSDCCVREGVSGYVAAMVCRSVQELRPSISTSGGQSARELEVVVVATAVVLSLLTFCLVCAAHAEKAAPEVHDRHLNRETLLVMAIRYEPP